MPSGKTHDLITLLLAAPILFVTNYYTNSLPLSIAVTVALIFGGLMFGPDLDINSRQYQRWGPLRICWWPYKMLFRHRSPFTHGILLGTIIRIVYFLVVVGVVFAIGLYLRELFQGGELRGGMVLISAAHRVIDLVKTVDRKLLLAIFIGLWLGAASHTIADLVVTTLKQVFKSL